MNAAGTAGNKGSHRRICRAGSPRAPQAGCGRGEERMNKHLARILVALTAAAMTVSQPIAGYAAETDSSMNVSVTRIYEFKVGDAVTSSETVASGGRLEKPEDPTEEGKKFDGWYVTENGEERPFNFDEELNFTDSSTITLTAKFSDAADEKTDKVKALYERLINAQTADELQATESSLSEEEEELMESFTSEQQDALKALSEKLGLYGTNATVSNEKTYEIEVGETTTLSGSAGRNAYDHSWTTGDSSIATVSAQGQGSSATVKGIAEGTTTIIHTYYTGYFMWGEKHEESFRVTVKAASSTVKVYVYVASGGFSDEMYDLLGIDKDTLDNNGYFPAGIIELDKSWLSGKNTTHGNALIKTDNDWTTLLAALGNMDVNSMVEMQGKDYSKNNGNKVKNYLTQAEKALNKTWGSGYTALFRWHYVPSGTAEKASSTCEYNGCYGSATHYGFSQQAGVLYHLDLKFSTKEITFITGNNGIKDGAAKDGTEVDKRTYITGSTIQEPRNLNIPDGYKLVGYYTSPDFEESTKWNGIGTPLNSDQTVYIKIVPKDNVTLKYVVAEGDGTVDPPDESFNPVTGTWSGSKASAGSGYTFAGWYADEKCTQELSDTEQYKPAEPEGGWTEGGTYIYYAKFIPSDKVLTIRKTLSGNMYDASKTFVFTISSGDAEMKWTTAEGEQKGTTITVSLGKDESTTEGEAAVWGIKVPAGAEVTVKENTDGYTQEIFGKPDDAEPVEGGISFTMPSEDTAITFDNSKVIAPDTGVVLDTLPYIVILALVAVGAVVFIRKRGRRIDD